ncbi:MAG: N-6 DNA methylase [Planctomycetota bacterium]|nr:N-6 DNA methylase [Planctomycetota bacterium]
MVKRTSGNGSTATTATPPRNAGGAGGASTNPNGAANRPTLAVKSDDKGCIFSHIRHKPLVETPEERVRQTYVVTLHNEYGFDLAQMDEELHVAGRGSARARADVLIWRTAQDKDDAKTPLIVVECKADNITIKAADYAQGEAYSLYCNAPFFVTHNNRETRYWRTRKERMPGHCEEIENIPHADASDRDIQELIAKLRAFKEDEFADLLHSCHNVIRNREHLDSAAAFDEIAKVLFVKVWVEREMKAKRRRVNLFTADYLDEQLGTYPLNDLFQRTKDAYAEDRIFAGDDRINVKPATGREIVRLLERYNLSDTSEDVKGIAFERFLGRTFRGEIGQFFTPRTIVEFMVRMLEPKEGDVVCDPASGSGGFLIRFFELVREQILADMDRQYQAYAAELDKKKLSGAKRAELLRDKYAELQKTIDQRQRDSRLWKLANRCIYGTDANDRMARTSKMNMIMHGDGHGGVHHHNGFINVNGIFEGRFDLILTNPPFGANVEPSDHITDGDISTSDEAFRRYADAYGQLYKDAQARVQAAKDKPIASLFELPARNGPNLGKVKTEILFIERCLSLLKPGGRMGIVLPEGIFNNPSLAYVREFCEDRARVLAVVSLSQDTFYSSGASVKASLLFLAKYTDEEAADFAAKRDKAKAEVEAKYAPAIATDTARLQAELDAATQAKDAQRRKAAQRQLAEYLAGMNQTKTPEARALLKERFDYPIFLYEAEKVGITATDEPDANELYPNADLPAGMKPEDTCLELHRRFLKSPKAFALPGGEP